MKYLIIIFLSFFVSLHVGGQDLYAPFKDTTINLGFEQIRDGQAMHFKKVESAGYSIDADAVVKHDGKYSMRFSFNGDSATFTAYLLKLPQTYKGSLITLSGYIKTAGVDPGRAGLLLRLDPRMGINNMYDHVVHGTTDWQKYEISLPLDADKTKQIVVGGILEGKGTMWLDDLEVKIDGKPLSEAVQFVANRYGADRDTTFSSGSGLTRMDTDQQTVSNLQTLGMVWGFLKYFHPRAGAGDINFASELFRLMPKVAAAKSNRESDDLLSTFITKLGSVEMTQSKVLLSKDESMVFDTDTTWWHHNGLSEKLVLQLRGILNAARGSNNFYFKFATAGNVVFTSDKEYPSLDNPDVGVRLLALYRYWNAIAYFYPYRDLITNWEKVLVDYIPIMTKADSRLKYELALASLVAKIEDTHAGITGYIKSTMDYYGHRSPAFSLAYIQNNWVVTKYLDVTTGPGSGVELGDVLDSINGKTVEEIVQSRLAITSASNLPTKYRNISWNLLKTNDSVMTLSFTRAGVTITKRVRTFPENSLAKLGFTNDRMPAFSNVSPGIAYVYGGTVKRKDIQSILSRSANAKGMIIDLRNYPHADGLFMLISMLSAHPVNYARISHVDHSHPGRAILGPNLSLGMEKAQAFSGELVVLVNGNTQSAAEFYGMCLRAIGATIIGSTTAGADGNVSQLYLPGSILTTFSGLGMYYPDGSPTQRVGIVPDIVCNPTITGVKEGKDEQLDRAIAFIKEGK